MDRRQADGCHARDPTNRFKPRNISAIPVSSVNVPLAVVPGGWTPEPVQRRQDKAGVSPQIREQVRTARLLETARPSELSANARRLRAGRLPSLLDRELRQPVSGIAWDECATQVQAMNVMGKACASRSCQRRAASPSGSRARAGRAAWGAPRAPALVRAAHPEGARPVEGFPWPERSSTGPAR